MKKVKAAVVFLIVIFISIFVFLKFGYYIRVFNTTYYSDENRDVYKFKFLGKYGLCAGTSSSFASAPVYDEISCFSEGMAYFRSGSKFGFFNRNGDEIIPAKYDGAKNFQNGIAPVSISGKWGAIDKKDNVMVDFKYDRLLYAGEGLLLCLNNENKYGYVDFSGAIVIPFAYSDATPFYDGIACVTQDEPPKKLTDLPQKRFVFYKYINTRGVPVIDREFAFAGTFKNGHAVVSVDMVHYGIVNKNGEFIVPLQFSKIDRIGYGFYTYNVTGTQLQGLIDLCHSKIYPQKYEIIHANDSSHINVFNNGKWTNLSLKDY